MFPLVSLSGLCVLIYIGCIAAVIIYVLRLLGRFVSAHERVARTLETIAQNQQDNGKASKP
jgi:hypothetical protein